MPASKRPSAKATATAPDDIVTTDDAGDTAAPPRRWQSPPRLVFALLATTVLASAAAFVFAVQLAGERARDDARAEALAAAEAFAIDLTTYDHRTLDADFARVLEGAADPFRSQYADTTEELAMLFTQFEATSTSTVLGRGVTESDEDSATVVLFVDQTVENTNSAEPRVDRNRVRITLEKVDGRWLASEVTVT